MSEAAAALRGILATALSLPTAAAIGVFVGHVPAGTPRPYVVIQGLADPGHHTLSGRAAIASPTFTIESYGRTSPEASALAQAVEDFLDGFKGRLGRLFFQGVFKRDGRGPNPVEAQDGAEPTTFRQDTDFQVWRAA